jgi:thymidylate synthase
MIKKCSKCGSEMTRSIIKALDSHNNFVEYCCKKCDFLDAAIEHIDDNYKVTNEKVILENVLLEFFNKIKNKEFVIDKTGVKTVEILALRMELDPNQPLLNFYDLRKSPEKYIQKEIEWYDSQDLSVKDIGQSAQMWLNVCSKDDKQLVNSNYGYLVYSKENGSQFDNVLKELIKNSYSRRALMIYNRPSMHYDYNKNGMSDFICTLGQQFVIRDNKLISIVEMRSSDMMYGFFSDFPWFAKIQQRLLESLRLAYPELTMGKLIWVSNSAHLYEKHFEVVSNIIEAAKKAGDL